MKVEFVLLLSATFAISTWLATVVAALNNLTWGMIRRLDAQKKRALQERAEEWMWQRSQLVMVTRGLAFLSLSLAVLSMYKLGEDLWPDYWAQGRHALPAMLLGVVLFVSLTELIGVWVASFTWPVLQISMPLVRTLRIFPGFFVMPAIAVQNKLINNSENDDEEEAKSSTEEEIEALLDHGNHNRDEMETSNGMEQITGRMIRGILDLDETLVKEIMTPRVDMDAIVLDAEIPRVKHRIIESGHSRIPVYGKDIDDIQGVVYSKDLLDDKNGQNDLRSIMHPAIFIPESKCVDDLLQEFKQSKVHIAVVIDEYGGTAGLVTLEDILEEIVGEIADEFDEADEEERPLQVAVDGSLTLDARTPIDDVNEVLDLDLPEEDDSVTIGGYIAGELGRIPKAGENLILQEMEIEVLTADERKLGQLRIKLLNPTDGQAPA